MKITFAMLLAAGLGWSAWWATPDQQGQRFFDRGEFVEAAAAFRDPMRQGVAYFRAGEFEKADSAFARVGTAEAEYNRGSCLILLGKYEAAVGRYDRALELRPGWEDAEVNRAIAAARAEKMRREGGDMGDQKIGADEIRFDKKKGSGGQDTELDGGDPLSDEAMQALWLRRVQTKPADFLRAKFSYQLAVGEPGREGEE